MKARALLLFVATAAALAACAPKAKTTFESKPQVLDSLTCIAVLPFENLATADDDPGAGDAFADLLATELLRTGRFQVMDRAESGRILAARGIYLGATVDAETARALGEVLGVQAVVVGAVNEYRFKPTRRDDRSPRPLVGVTTKILDVKNGDALWGTSFAGSPTTFFGDPSVPLTVAAQRVAADVSGSLASASGNKMVLPSKPCWDAKAQSVLATLGGGSGRTAPTPAIAVNTPAATPMSTAIAMTTPVATATPLAAVSPVFVSETPVPARKPLTAPQAALKEKMKPSGVFVLDGIAYTTPSGTVLAPVSSAPISDLAAVLLAYPEAKLRVEGHVDPTDPGPVPLSQKRAEAVVTKLQSLGIPAGQVEPKGMGGSKSLFPSFVEAMKAKNRRIEISVITPPPEGGAVVASATPSTTPVTAAATTARVKVLASKGRSAQAVKLANELKQGGTKITTIANVPEQRTSTLIYYTAAFENDAKKLAKQIPVPGGAKLTLYKTLGAGVDMVIVVGSDLK